MPTARSRAAASFGFVAMVLVQGACAAGGLGAARTVVVETVPTDSDRDGRFESLLVRATIPVPARGRYEALVTLHDPRTQDESSGTVAYGRAAPAGPAASAIPAIRLEAAAPGPVLLSAWFDGDAIARKATAGSLLVRIAVASARPPGSQPVPGRLYEGRTSQLDPLRFGSSAARVDTVMWKAREDTLTAWVVLEVPRAAPYIVEANVLLDSVWLARTEVLSELSAGRHRVRLASPIAGLGRKLRGLRELVFEVQVFTGTERVATWRGGVGESATD